MATTTGKAECTATDRAPDSRVAGLDAHGVAAERHRVERERAGGIGDRGGERVAQRVDERHLGVADHAAAADR